MKNRIFRSGTFRIGLTLWFLLPAAHLLTASPFLLAQAVRSVASLPATVTFTLDFPQSNPEHYSISLDENGHARYECSGKLADDSEKQTYRSEFDVTPGSRGKVFEWTKQARYFAQNLDSGNKKLAYTGTKILSYQDGQRSNTEQYGYSSLAPIQQLTAFFQNLADTMDYGRRLAYYHRYQKLALDEELKRMESQAKNNQLVEIQGVAPVLQEIVDDASVINVVRARAQTLLQMGGGVAVR